MFVSTMKNVAVIGAGAAGLCALRLLACNSKGPSTFRVTAFEQSSNIGGTWLYTDCVGTDELGLPVHSSMYKSLRTNLPKECMAYPDYPFPSNLPSFVTHDEVQKYLEDYATHFTLWKLIKFRTIVENIKPIPDDDNKFGVRWKITTANVMDREVKKTELFDAVLVCNGHFAKPLVPEIPGLDTFEGHIMHSHDYRQPQPRVHSNKRVIVLGAQSSGQDISVELAKVATKVYLCHNKRKLSTFLPPNVEQKPGIKCCNGSSVEFDDGTFAQVDALVMCTGYDYQFDFLDESIGLKVEDGRITPLFEHLLPIGFPSIGLVGVLKTVVPLPLFYMQIKYFISILVGTGNLPSKKEMIASEDEDFERLKAQGLPHRYAHVFGSRQFDYWKRISELGNFDNLPPVIEKIYNKAHEFRHADVTTYRNINFILTEDGKDFVIEDTSKNRY